MANPISKLIKLQDWRKAIAYVSQDIILISGTIRDNIIYGLDREVSQEELEEACRRADALDFILQLDNGFDHAVGEFGNHLSGGQRQRLCIARAFLANPEILLLDEFTSNLDMESGDKVQRALDELSERKTAIVVTHSLPVVKKADHIVVLHHGSVVGAGDHATLLASNEHYRSIFEQKLFS